LWLKNTALGEATLRLQNSMPPQVAQPKEYIRTNAYPDYSAKITLSTGCLVLLAAQRKRYVGSARKRSYNQGGRSLHLFNSYGKKPCAEHYL